jgi:hypothetical protein
VWALRANAVAGILTVGLRSLMLPFFALVCWQRSRAAGLAKTLTVKLFAEHEPPHCVRAYLSNFAAAHS